MSKERINKLGFSARCFSLIELLVVIGIIALLAGLLFPVYHRSRQKAKETQCINQLKQIGTGLQMYRDNHDQHHAPWVSRLFPDYIKIEEVYKCPCDGNPSSTAADKWLARPDDDHNLVYDRIGNIGLHINPNPDVGSVSYFYEFSDAECTWGLTDSGLSSPYTWAQLKEVQLKNGGDSVKPPGEGYDPTIFPVFRCFWHLQKLKDYSPSKHIPNQACPVLNISYAGNFFYSRARWEDGQWTP